jgi:CRP-like cAMP-binding protein
VAFLDRLRDADRHALLAAGQDRRFRGGSRVFQEGDRGDFVLVVLDGRVKIEATSTGGVTSVLSVRGPGELVGELAAIDFGPRLASAVALDPVQARIIHTQAFRQLVSRHPTLALALMELLTSRLREADRRRIEFGSADATARLAQLLVDLARDVYVASPGPVEVRLSQHELAGMIGASRESVARALVVLRDADLVTTGRRSVTVVDLEGLGALSR